MQKRSADKRPSRKSMIATVSGIRSMTSWWSTLTRFGKDDYLVLMTAIAGLHIAHLCYCSPLSFLCLLTCPESISRAFTALSRGVSALIRGFRSRSHGSLPLLLSLTRSSSQGRRDHSLTRLHFLPYYLILFLPSLNLSRNPIPFP